MRLCNWDKKLTCAMCAFNIKSQEMYEVIKSLNYCAPCADHIKSKTKTVETPPEGHDYSKLFDAMTDVEKLAHVKKYCALAKVEVEAEGICLADILDVWDFWLPWLYEKVGESIK